MKSPIFEMSADARILSQELAKLRPGETITYRTLGHAIGRKVVGSTTSLQTARRALLRNEQILFSPIRGEGLYRMRDEEIVANADRDINHIRMSGRRGVQRLAAVQNYAEMPRAKQLSHAAKMSVLTAVTSLTTERSLKNIEEEVARHPERRELPVAQTLAAFASTN